MPDQPPIPDARTIWITNSRAEIDRAEETVLASLTAHGYADASRFAVRLALEEALANAFHHGHRHLTPETPIRLDYRVDPDRVSLIVTDQGPGFTPADVPDPTADDRLEIPAGRGLLLMRAYMTRVEHDEKGSTVTMIYERPRDQH